MGNDTNNPTEFDEANAWKAHVTPIQITTALTFTIGCVHFACGIFRLKFISTYLSDALIKGLTTGAAVHVMVSQIDDILGIEIGRISGIGMILFKMIEIVKKISFVNYVTLGASVITYGFLYVGETYINPLMEKLFKKKIPIPYEMIVMLAFTVVSSIVGFEDKFKVEVVGEVPSGIPVPEVPVFQIVPDLITNAVSIAMVIMALHLSMTKMLADMLKYEVDAGQELYAISFTSVLSSFFPVYPNSIALGRTFVLVNSGGKTMMTNLFSSILMLLVIFFIGPLLYSLPMCILSSIIAFALRPMFRNLLLLPDIYKVSKYDASIFGVAFLGTLATDIVTGFLMSVGFALFTGKNPL
uniref:Sulfate_transp domain-containing protein n=1 Tax=Rhabditophanes sp. KR3021 TaxID=114890 RepID=A0AC35TH80_9BILA